MEQEQAYQLDCWAIIELFGHSRIAGKVRAENFGSACMIRVDVPTVRKQRKKYDYDKQQYIVIGEFEIEGFTKYVGVGSIYALTPVTQELATAAAREISAEPVSLFGAESVRRLSNALPASDDADEQEEDDRGDEGLI